MVREGRMEPQELWEALKDWSEGSAVYVTSLPEDVSCQEGEEREGEARRIGSRLCSVPSLVFYSRVGMYDYLGVSRLPVEALRDWFGNSSDMRCGLAVLGKNSLKTIEILMMGTVEAARQDRGKYAFRLVDGWVVPD